MTEPVPGISHPRRIHAGISENQPLWYSHCNQQPLVHSDWSIYNRFSGYAYIATTAMPSSRTGADAGLGTEMRYVIHLGLEVMSAMCLRFGYHYIRINSSAIATY
jgi:hypothetical protein